jgi:hypothetical protein
MRNFGPMEDLLDPLIEEVYNRATVEETGVRNNTDEPSRLTTAVMKEKRVRGGMLLKLAKRSGGLTLERRWMWIVWCITFRMICRAWKHGFNVRRLSRCSSV